MFNKKWFLPLMLVLLLSLTACTTNDVDSKPDTDAPPVEDAEQPSGDDEAPIIDNKDEDVLVDEYTNIKIKPEEAFDIFMEKYPTTKITKVKLDKEMGKFVYNLEGFERNKEYEVKIDSVNGNIIKEYMETDDDMDEMEITRVNVEKIIDLVEKAMAEAGVDAKLEEWTLDTDDGRVKLEVEMDKKGFGDLEYTYDVETGELIEIDD